MLTKRFPLKYIQTLILITLLFSSGCKNNDTVQPVENPTFDSIVPNTEDIVMYEINLRAFSSEGTFNGIAARLDSIKALGVNVIWLMPIHPVGVLKSVGQLGSPYSVQNYLAVNSEFGTLDNFKNLLSKAHDLGISVILDWVANHSSWDNPWIINKNWYTQDGSGNIVSPAGTGWNDVADLNYNNSEMRLAMISAMKYWAKEIGVDGFRCDAADYVPYSFWKQALDTLKNISNKKLILLAEGSRSDHFTAGFQINYAWDYYSSLKNVFRDGYYASSLFTTNQNEFRSAVNGTKLRFTTNHDESAWDNPPVVLFNGKLGALAASVAALFMGGVPLIYCGQEVGYPNKLPFFSRSPIDWSINPDMKAAYKKLFSLYNSNPVLKKGTISDFSDSYVVAITKSYQTHQCLILINTRNVSETYKLASSFQNITWTNLLDNSSIKTNGEITVTPYQYLILFLTLIHNSPCRRYAVSR